MDNRDVIFEGVSGPGLTPQQDFEARTGRTFDPETMEVVPSPGAIDNGYDAPLEGYAIVEKTKENVNESLNTANNDIIFEGESGPGLTPQQEFEFRTGQKFDPETMEIVPAPGAIDDGYDSPIERFAVVSKTKSNNDVDSADDNSEDTTTTEEVVDEEKNEIEQKNIKDLTDKELDDEINSFENGDFDISFTDPKYQRYMDLKNEKERRVNNTKNEEKDYSKLTDDEIANKIRELSEKVGSFSDEVDEKDPRYIEYWELIGEQTRRKKTAKEKTEKKDYSKLSDGELQDNITQLWGELSPIYAEIDDKDPRYLEYWKLVREQERRKKEKEELKKEEAKKDGTTQNDNNVYTTGGFVTVDLDKLKHDKDSPYNVDDDNTNTNTNGNTNGNGNNVVRPSVETVKIIFMNGGKVVPNYGNIVIEKGGTIKHGPVIDPVPLNKKGKPKRFTAKTFSHWEDQYGNVVDFSKPITEDVVLSAVYKFDKKKAVAVGLGAAVGALAYVSDLAIPVPLPVVSMVGAAGTKIANHFVKKNLGNLTADNMLKARTITALDDIPEELSQNIIEQKKKGYISTFLNTAAVACTISTSAHLLKASHAAEKGLDNTNSAPKKDITSSTNGLDNTPTNTIGNGRSNITGPTNNVNPTNISSTTTTTTTPPKTVSTDVLGGYEPTGQVYRSASDAINNVNGTAPYTPSFAGEKTYQVFNPLNGAKESVSKGQELSEIMQMVGASDPSQVGVNVMNAEGTPLTWQSLSSMAETVTKTI